MYEALVERFWAQPEYRTMRCRDCGDTEHVRVKLGIARILAHAVLSALTYGMWVPVWLSDYAFQKTTWACGACEKRRGLLHQYKEVASFPNPHEDRWHWAMGLVAAFMFSVMALTRPAPGPSPAVAGAASVGAPGAAQSVPSVRTPIAADALADAQRTLDAWVPSADPAKTDWGDLAKAQTLLQGITARDLENGQADVLRAEVARRVAEKNKVFDAQREAANKAAEVERAAAAKVAAAALQGLRTKHDKMDGVTWYHHPSSPQYANTSAFYLYFGRNESGYVMPLRLVVRYFADDWLFVERAWAKADGDRVEIPQESKSIFGWERDNSGGNVWEWSDVAVDTGAEKNTVRKLANAKSVTIRFEGKQYRKDRNLSAQEMKALREVIAAYEAASGRPWH